MNFERVNVYEVIEEGLNWFNLKIILVHLGDSSKYSVEKNWESKQRKVSGEQCLDPSKSVLMERLTLLIDLDGLCSEIFRLRFIDVTA